MGATVVIACRSEEKAQQAISRMNEEFREEKNQGTAGICDQEELNARFMKLDNSSLKAVMAFVQEFKASGLQLHVLICNAGVGVHKQEYTEDGNEFLFQVNYLGHFLLTMHLLPVMKTSGPDCRVVMVSSIAHLMVSFNLDEIQGKQYTEASFDGFKFYNRSKLYQIMQMHSMNRRLLDSDVTVTTVHPGIVSTDLIKTFSGGFIGLGVSILKGVGASKTPFAGAWTSLNAAVNPTLAGVRDVYFSDSKPTTTSYQARKEKDQEALWSYTLDCLKDYLTDDVIKNIGDVTQ